MTIKVRIASRAPFTFDSGAGVDLTREGNVVTAQLNYADLAAGTVAGSWLLAGYDPSAEAFGSFTLSAALAISHTHTLSQISDMSADARAFCAAANYAAMRTAIGFDEAVDDRVGSLLVAGAGILLAYNDGANTLTISASGTGGVAFAGLANNMEIVASVASSALTVALKTAAGTDPSASDPVTLVFPSATEGDGSQTTRTLTAATSLTISNGSNLGQSANNEAFRLWLVAFDDAGTVRLGLINCRDRTTNGIYQLGGWGVASSTAEGGAGAADSAHVFYTGTAVTTKPYIVLGYVEYGSGLSSAGAYAGAPTRIRMHQRGMKLPGDVVQPKSDVYTTSTGLTTVTPIDDTIPQSSEGTQLVSFSMTPNSAANVFEIDYGGFGGISAASFVLCPFSSLSTDAIHVSATFVPSGGITTIAGLTSFFGNTTSSITFSLRAGPGSGTLYMNGTSAGRLFGARAATYLRVKEIMG